jgi:ribose 5-phosphate isomerase RpiB
MEMAMRHNCANFFAIPAMNANSENLHEYLRLGFQHTFDGGRHQLRIQELE